jgi:hypothetical protein
MQGLDVALRAGTAGAQGILRPLALGNILDQQGIRGLAAVLCAGKADVHGEAGKVVAARPERGTLRPGAPGEKLFERKGCAAGIGGKELGYRLVEEIHSGAAKKLFRPGIEAGDAAILVEGDDARADVLDDGFRGVQRAFEPAHGTGVSAGDTPRQGFPGHGERRGVIRAGDLRLYFSGEFFERIIHGPT